MLSVVAARATGYVQLPSCVPDSPPLQLRADAPMATLDGSDRTAFQARAQQLYPLYQQGGTQPSDVLLLRRDGHWLYVTVESPNRRTKCFTAVFAADRFDFTEPWLRRYRPRARLADD